MTDNSVCVKAVGAEWNETESPLHVAPDTDAGIDLITASGRRTRTVTRNGMQAAKQGAEYQGRCRDNLVPVPSTYYGEREVLPNMLLLEGRLIRREQRSTRRDHLTWEVFDARHSNSGYGIQTLSTLQATRGWVTFRLSRQP
jgi:hypothetical protein